MLIDESFLTTRGGWKLKDGDDKYRDHFQALQDTFLDKQHLNASVFENISATECIHRYQATFIRADNGIAVMAPHYSVDAIDNSSLLDFGIRAGELHFRPKFISSLLCKSTQAVYYVSHSCFADCISKISPERCHVQLTQSILYVVIACNILKIVLMLIVLGWMNYETIVTIGDAIETFILEPDVSTKNCCLASSHSLMDVLEARRIHRHQPGNKVRWYIVVSGKRWFCSLLL